MWNRTFFFTVIFALIAGCDSIPIDKIGFCYQDEDGKQYCGNIGFRQAESDKANSVIVEKEDTAGGKKEVLYTFTEDQIGKLFSMFPGLAGARTAKLDPLDTYRRIKEILGVKR